VAEKTYEGTRDSSKERGWLGREKNPRIGRWGLKRYTNTTERSKRKKKKMGTSAGKKVWGSKILNRN